MGARTLETIGSCTFEDLTNHRKAVLMMTTFKHTGWISSASVGSKDEVEGVIYDSQKLSGDMKSIKKNYGKDIEFVKSLKDIKDMKKKICNI